MEHSSFHILLPSDANQLIHPSNSPHDFRVKLPRRIELDGEWEVGLKEITFSSSYPNYVSTRSKITYGPNGDENELVLPTGRYDSMPQLIRTLLAIAKPQLPQGQSLKVTLRSDRVTITPTGFVLKIEGDLSRMLGFGDSIVARNAIQADYAPNLSMGLRTAHVYCNIVQSQMVGDEQIPLLRRIDLEDRNSNDVITKTYESPIYVPLLQKSFDTVHMNISRVTGEVLQFNHGIVVYTLHFKRRYLL